MSRQENELAEERKRQTSALNEQRKTIQSLEEELQKREAAMTKTKEEVRTRRENVDSLVQLCLGT